MGGTGLWPVVLGVSPNTAEMATMVDSLRCHQRFPLLVEIRRDAGSVAREACAATQKCAMTSISTFAPFGSAATWIVERAGKSLVKYFA